jgi:hypothetical protein
MEWVEGARVEGTPGDRYKAQLDSLRSQLEEMIELLRHANTHEPRAALTPGTVIDYLQAILDSGAEQ